MLVNPQSYPNSVVQQRTSVKKLDISLHRHLFGRIGAVLLLQGEQCPGFPFVHLV